MKNIDIVYHCAATAHEGLSVFSPYEITKNNYLASVSIFSAAINSKVRGSSTSARSTIQALTFSVSINSEEISATSAI